MSQENSTKHAGRCVTISGFWIALAITLWISGCASTSPSRSGASSSNATSPSGPTAGYIWDSRLQGLRTLSGSLGAAHLENPLSGLSLRSATPCASHAFALGSDISGNVLAIALPSGLPTKLGDVVASDQQIILSPTCASAIIYSPSRGSGFLIGGLPSSPHVQSVHLGASGTIAGAAISDSGAILFATPKSDGTVSLQIVPASGAAQTLPASVGKVGGMAFLPGVDSAIIADSLANVVYFGKQLSADSTFTAIASSAQGVSDPRAVAASMDGHFAFIANAATKNLLRIDLTSSAAPIPIACNCTPSELIPLSGNAGFQITDPAVGVIFALNGDGPSPRTVFIPTNKVNAATGGAQ